MRPRLRKRLPKRVELSFAPAGKRPDLDTEAVAKYYGLSLKFPQAALSEAKACGERIEADKEIGRKAVKDLRREFVFTCDPASARDFDDALSIALDGEGNYVLGVHIADVSRYVRPGSALDREAFRRSFSVYFPDRVLPMLPETLSNGLCSLNPGVDRFAFTVRLTFNAKGENLRREFYRSVIRSKARFAYEEVLLALNGKGKLAPRALKAVKLLDELSQVLRLRRFAAGALDLEVPEFQMELDENGEMVGIVRRESDRAHQLVEECMIAANEAVARELWTNGVKILARLHEPPEEEKLLALKAELRSLGFKVGDLRNRKVFARFIANLKHHPLASTLSMAVLRSLKKALYDAKAIGHYGLAKKYYAHFTSPIRRYPDLTLHRQLQAYLENRRGVKRAEPKVPSKTLAAWAAAASAAEIKATDAERALLEIKRYRYLEREFRNNRGAIYRGVVVKCMPFGCFVELPELGVSGLVHISDLAREYVRYNESEATLSVAGKSWRLGDELAVRVKDIDFEARHIDFIPTGDKFSQLKKKGRLAK